MKESVGYTVTLNIIIVFVVIVFAFLAASLSYFKANKVNKIIINSIEKYEGWNELSINEIRDKISSMGYSLGKVSCPDYVERITNVGEEGGISSPCGPATNSNDNKIDGICVYYCNEEDYYYYKVATNMMMNIPIINSVLPIRIFSNTNRMYNFTIDKEDVT